MSKIGYKLDEPDIITYEGIGVVAFFEFENDIWVQEVFVSERGKGTALARRFIKYARERGKSIYGMVNPQWSPHAMEFNRLKRWYHLLGGEDVKIEKHPHAMRLEIKK
jgi:hypothetical protein